MSYYQDLTPYEYRASREPEGVHAINVGWLSHEHRFAKGETSREFKERLLLLCQDQHIVNVMRGFHSCEFCDDPSPSWYAENEFRYGANAHWASIGDGEIRVFGKDVTFAAPALVYHYVLEHGYLPPSCFIDAVLNAPPPDSAEHRAQLSRWRCWRPIHRPGVTSRPQPRPQ